MNRYETMMKWVNKKEILSSKDLEIVLKKLENEHRQNGYCFSTISQLLGGRSYSFDGASAVTTPECPVTSAFLDSLRQMSKKCEAFDEKFFRAVGYENQIQKLKDLLWAERKRTWSLESQNVSLASENASLDLEVKKLDSTLALIQRWLKIGSRKNQ